MTATVRLLGRPGIDQDGSPIVPQPRGLKVWALLAHLVLTDRPVSRAQLVALLFDGTQDPLQALRWNLSELRRALRGTATLDGDPLVLELLPGTRVDVRQLTDGSPAMALGLPGFGSELLQGITLPGAPAFEAWLAAERARTAACSRAVLVERALDLLAAGTAPEAARLAARAVALDPLDADHHTLLVRSLTAAGDRRGARAQAVRCTDLFRRELGCAPPNEVLAAAAPEPPARTRTASPAAVHSWLDAGRASLTAGAVDRGLEQLRQAASAAAVLGDDALRARSLVALAGARVHSTGERGTAVRGLLQQAEGLAHDARVGDVEAAACRELGFLAVQRAQQDRALVWLDRGDAVVTDDAERAKLAGVRGMCLSDAAEHVGALAQLDTSVELAVLGGDVRQEAWSRSMLGRVHTVRREPRRAIPELDAALALVAAQGWTAFAPWPEALRAQAAIQLGDLTSARDLLDHAWVLATESGDHCWIAVVALGQARLALATGAPEGAAEWCAAGLRPVPWYVWPYACLLELSCALPGAGAGDRLEELVELAGRGSLRDLLVRAHLHRARAGSPTALSIARAIAAGIDDPALHQQLRGVT